MRVACPLLAALCIGCSPATASVGYRFAAPDAKLAAIERSQAADDRSAIPEIVECLGSDDALVRCAAIDALRSWTGSTLGYRFDDPTPARRAAIRRWVAWMNSQSASGAVDG